jgi:hypothetical protein
MNEPLPNPFETARRRSDLITVALKTSDLIDAEPALSIVDATHLLQQHGPAIATAMLTAGVAIAIDLYRKVDG